MSFASWPAPLRSVPWVWRGSWNLMRGRPAATTQSVELSGQRLGLQVVAAGPREYEVAVNPVVAGLQPPRGRARRGGGVGARHQRVVQARRGGSDAFGGPRDEGPVGGDAGLGDDRGAAVEVDVLPAHPDDLPAPQPLSARRRSTLPSWSGPGRARRSGQVLPRPRRVRRGPRRDGRRGYRLEAGRQGTVAPSPKSVSWSARAATLLREAGA